MIASTVPKRSFLNAPLPERIEKASTDLASWVKESQSLEETLLEWLSYAPAGQLITNYSEFRELAAQLKTKKVHKIVSVPNKEKFLKAKMQFVKKTNKETKEVYQELLYELRQKGINLPPSNKFDSSMATFFESFLKARGISLRKKGPLKDRIKSASNDFASWDDPYNTILANSLLTWVSGRYGGKYIANYEEFEALVHELNQKGVKIEVMPTLEQFNKGMAKFISEIAEQELPFSRDNFSFKIHL